MRRGFEWNVLNKMYTTHVVLPGTVFRFSTHIKIGNGQRIANMLLQECWRGVYPKMAAKSSFAVEMGLRSNSVTKKPRILDDKKAGSDGSIRILLIPSDSRESRMTTAFCSYQEGIIDNGRSLTPHSNALASACAILTAE